MLSSAAKSFQHVLKWRQRRETRARRELPRAQLRAARGPQQEVLVELRVAGGVRPAEIPAMGTRRRAPRRAHVAAMPRPAPHRAVVLGPVAAGCRCRRVGRALPQPARTRATPMRRCRRRRGEHEGPRRRPPRPWYRRSLAERKNPFGVSLEHSASAEVLLRKRAKRTLASTTSRSLAVHESHHPHLDVLDPVERPQGAATRTEGDHPQCRLEASIPSIHWAEAMRLGLLGPHPLPAFYVAEAARRRRPAQRIEGMKQPPARHAGGAP